MVSSRSALCLVFAALALICTSAWAQKYPARPVRIIVPFGTGGPADIYARYLAQKLQAPLGQPLVVVVKIAGARTDR